MLRGVIFLLMVAGLTGCHGTLSNGVYRRDGVAYRVVEPPADAWRSVDFADNDLAWVSRNSGHVLAVNATCGSQTEDPPLEVLTNHLVMGFTDRQWLSREKFMLDGREAERSKVQARLDGVPTSVQLVVLKKNDCVHDFSYVSPLGEEAAHQRDFDALVAGFAQEHAP